MFGIGVKEIATGQRPIAPQFSMHPTAEEAPYQEQELVVPRLPLEHFDDPEFEVPSHHTLTLHTRTPISSMNRTPYTLNIMPYAFDPDPNS